MPHFRAMEPMAMPKQRIAQWIAQPLARGLKLALCAALCSGPLLAAAASVPDQPVKQPVGQPPSATAQKAHPHKRIAKPSPATPAPQIVAAPPVPVAPPPPDWPVNDKPAAATVVWDSHGLRVDANNSSLSQILTDVSTDTGTKVEGLGAKDVRVFGTYGPGPANEVIAQLLNGTGYNVLMVGDQGSGAPRQIVLSSAPSGPAAQNNARNNNSNDDDYEPEQPIQEPTPQQPNGGFVPPQPMNQQQMQEMQMRQEQLQQQMRNQMLQQQGQPTPADTQAPQH